jgi:aryl carrier-like protein
MRLLRKPLCSALVTLLIGSLPACAATFTWDGGGDGVNWTDPLNWNSNAIPGAADDAVLGVGAAVSITAGVQARSLQSERALTLTTGGLTVYGGASLVKGMLTMAPGTALTATGAGTTFVATNTAVVDGASFFASAGAALHLPGLRDYLKPDGCYDVSFQADGIGSLLDLSGVTNVHGGNCAWLRIRAVSGGSVNLTNVLTLSDSYFEVYADGAASVVDFRRLTNFSSPDRWLALAAYNSGQVRLPALWGSPRMGLDLRNGGLVDTAQLQRLGGVTVENQTLTLGAVTNIDGASLSANVGGSLSLPLVRQVNKLDGCYDVNWVANGLGAVLNLSAVTNFYGGNCAWQRLQALAGGSINVSNLVTISDGWVLASADGAGSLVDLRKLASFPSSDRWLGLEASNGGQVLSPVLTGGTRVGLSLGAGGLLNSSQLTRVGGVTVSGVALTLPAVTNIDGAGLTVNAGGSLSLPLVRRVTKQDGCYDVTWVASGTGAVLNLSGVTNLYGGNCAWQRMQALAGGSIILSNLVGLADGWVQAYADGAGSLVDLRRLASFPSLDRWLSLEAYNGGQVLAPLLTDGARIGLSLSQGGLLNTSQFYRIGGVTLAGVALTLSGVTNVDGASFTVNAGGSLALPLVRQITKPDGCHDANWYASGAGAMLDLSAVTNIYAGNCSWLRFVSSGGGQILLSNVVAVTDGYMIASADGAGSQVDLRRLISFPSVDRWLSLEAYNGGEIITSVFPGGPRVGIGASNGGLLSTNQFKRLGGITLSGMALTLPAVTNLDGAACTVNAGGNLSLPLVRQLNKPDGCYDMNWFASGAGAVINLAPVTNAYGGNCGWLRFQASAGGYIILSNLVATTNGSFSFRAEDAGSVVDLRKLASFPGLDRWFSLEAVNSGLVMCSNFAGGARVGVTLANSGAMPTAQFRQLGGIAVSAAAATFAGLTNLDGAAVTAYAGGTISLPALQHLTKSPGCSELLWNAEGLGCRIDAPALQSIATTDGCGWLRLWAKSGGQLGLSNVVSLAGQAAEVLADGAGSLIDLTRLGSFISPGPGTSALTAQNGGVILLGSQAFLLANVNVTIPPGNPVLPPAVISGPNLTLYGTAWRSYLVEQQSTLNPTNAWQFFLRVPLTNSFQPIAGSPAEQTAFRVTEFIANPPIVDLNRVPTNQFQLVLYGVPASNFELLSRTNLTTGATWQPLTSVTLTNPFRIFAPMTATNAARFYRAKQS